LNKSIYFFDFDSTLINAETLDLIASNKNLKDFEIEKIKEITNQAMNGEISFNKALNERLKILKINQNDVFEIKNQIHAKINKSILDNISFFSKNNCFIISGGFREIIQPVADILKIPFEKVFANNLIFDQQFEHFILDNENPLAHNKGKSHVINQLDFKENQIMIGDGYTDLEVKLENPKIKFYAYTEVVYRNEIVIQADKVISNLNEL
jgi:D-3-phosphoglycerate dehydrogenase